MVWMTGRKDHAGWRRSTRNPQGGAHGTAAFAPGGKGTGLAAKNRLPNPQGLTDTSFAADHTGVEILRWSSPFSTIFSV
jgi:hypothetical protein